jgi:hypothetical protein
MGIESSQEQKQRKIVRHGYSSSSSEEQSESSSETSSKLTHKLKQIKKELTDKKKKKSKKSTRSDKFKKIEIMSSGDSSNNEHAIREEHSTTKSFSELTLYQQQRQTDPKSPEFKSVPKKQRDTLQSPEKQFHNNFNQPTLGAGSRMNSECKKSQE